MYIKEYTNGIFVRTEKNDRPCTHPDGHEFTIHGAWGSTCHHCGHYVGGTCMETIGEAQAYAQNILGATGPVEVREIEWKFGPGNVPKSPVIREIADSNGTPVIELPAHKDEEVRHA